MADTIFDVNDPLAVQLWARVLDHEAIRACVAHKLIGTTPNSIILKRDEMQAQAGHQLTYGIMRQLDAPGVIGDDDLMGNEEEMVRDRDTITINQLRHAVRVKGSMSQQRVPFRIRDEGLSLLRDWGATRFDVSIMNQLAGNAYQNDEGSYDVPPGKEFRYTGMQAAVAPDAAHHLVAGAATTEAALNSDTTAVFSLGLVDTCKTLSQMMEIPIRPVKMGELECHAMLINPFQLQQLRSGTTDYDWSGVQRAAMQGGLITKNPLFTGAAGMWNNTVFIVSGNLPYGDDTIALAKNRRLSLAASGTNNVARAVFCGATAGCIAFGRTEQYVGTEIKWKWTEVLEDHENRLSIGISLVWGAKKTRYVDMASDYATITVSTYSPAPVVP